MIGYVKLKSENKELYEENFLEKLKNKNTKFSKLQYNICYFFYKFIVYIKYIGNIITVKQIYYSYIFIFPFDNRNINKYKLKRCMKKLKKLMPKYKVNTIELSNELKEKVKKEEYCNLIKTSGKNEIEKTKCLEKINYLEENSLMPYLIQEVFSYILEAKQKRTEFEDLYICIKEISTFYIENIYYLSNYFKTINIITPNIKKIEKIADKLEQNGILITVTNNKEKSLRKAKFIVNIDFNKEEISKFTICRTAIIISIKEKEAYTNIGFNGIQIKQIQIDVANEIKNVFRKYNLLENYPLSDLYNSILSETKGFESAKLKMEKDKIKITKLYGNNGEISQNEYIKLLSY